MEEATLRIGELARRTQVSADVLRKWESRYGLLRPARASGGYRLYSEADVQRVREMQRQVAAGLAAAEAARLVVASAEPGAAAPAELETALTGFDEAGAQRAFDRLVAAFTVETLVDQSVLPLLQRLGRRWADGEASVAEEHFATAFLRGRLLGLARGWGGGAGRHALLAAPSGEQHDLGLVCFGLLLRGAGWRITYLGGDTPADTVMTAARQLNPDAVVVASLSRRTLGRAVDGLRMVGWEWPLWIAGSGATRELADRCGAQLLDGGMVDGVARVAAAR